MTTMSIANMASQLKNFSFDFNFVPNRDPIIFETALCSQIPYAENKQSGISCIPSAGNFRKCIM